MKTTLLAIVFQMTAISLIADDLKNEYEKYPERTCLVLGSEGQGIRKKVKDYCDIMIKIPMFGKINSLNVSVAGGILLSEISKNRRG